MPAACLRGMLWGRCDPFAEGALAKERASVRLAGIPGGLCLINLVTNAHKLRSQVATFMHESWPPIMIKGV